MPARREELALLADWIEAKRVSDGNEDKDLIVMGDFNIPKVGDPLFQALTKHGLRIPDALTGLKHGTNLAKDKRYDQILGTGRIRASAMVPLHRRLPWAWPGG